MPREHSPLDEQEALDIASAVVDGHRLLPKQPAESTLGA
jgi:hypothetical protein